MSGKLDTIILAGGRGTRLQSVVQDVPKPLADIAGRPFLDFVIGSREFANTGRVILSIGYKSEKIEESIARWSRFDIRTCVEDEPLGTGGAIQKSMELAETDPVLVLNGDTFFEFDNAAMLERHRSTNADITLCVTPMKDFDRYGCVHFAGDRVTAFAEKQFVNEGYINAGVYLIRAGLLPELGQAGRYSFEKDVLEAFIDKINIVPFVSPGYFIDIGIPEDYSRAQSELPERVAVGL